MDSVRRWNLWFPLSGVFAEVLAGRATRSQLNFLPIVISVSHIRHQSFAFICEVRSCNTLHLLSPQVTLYTHITCVSD